MTNGAATADRIYDAWKSALLPGRRDPYGRLDFAAIARRLEVSTISVRESAMRLLGEGLLDWHEPLDRLALE